MGRAGAVLMSAVSDQLLFRDGVGDCLLWYQVYFPCLTKEGDSDDSNNEICLQKVSL